MAGRRWLWETADELLAAWCPPGSEQTDAGGRTWTERGATPDLEPFHRAYDQLLWEVVTSPPAGLAAFAARFYEEPYLNLPPPLKVVVWRLVGLEAGGVEQLRAAVTGITLYCDPAEEAGAAGGIQARIRSLFG